MRTLLFLMLFGGCSTYSPDISGTWVENYEHMDLMILRPDSTMTLYLKVGTPWAKTWDGYWRPEGSQIIILNSRKVPLTVANYQGSGQFALYIFNEIHYFHRYGAAPKEGPM